MDGIVCVYKPSDWTSFDVVAKVRGITRTRKVGHAGTLDPMATGVLPLFLGGATKLCDILPNHDKEYIATLQFGKTTDTLDDTGKVLTQCESHVTEGQLRELLPQFVGQIDQIPPMFSAVRVQGRRLYDIARSGQEVVREPRPVTVYEIELLSFDGQAQRASLRVACSKGTYIRTLCSDIGTALQVGATMTALERSMAAGFTLEECSTMDQLQVWADQGELVEHLISMDRPFLTLSSIKLNKVQAHKFLHGVQLNLERVHYTPGAPQYTVYDPQKQFLGLAHANEEEQKLVIDKLLCKPTTE